MKTTLLSLLTITLVTLIQYSKADMVAYWDFNGNLDDATGAGNDGTILNNATYGDDTPTDTGQSLSVPGGAENNGVLIPGTNLGSNPFTLSYWIKPTSATANAGLERITSRGGDQFETGIGNAFAAGGTSSETGTTLSYYPGGSGWQVTNVPITINEWTHVAWSVSPESTTLYINGEEAYVGIGASADKPGTNDFFIGTRHNSVEGYEGFIDEMFVWDDSENPLSPDQIALFAEGINPFSSDEDEDGLPDSWEDLYGLDPEDDGSIDVVNGPDGDGDGDGLINVEEFEQHTDPTEADTDGDGLTDGAETNTGTFISVTNTGTSPTKADSDKDGLDDGAETNTGTFINKEDTGTDPNNKDTDGDGFGDGNEVAGGTDPHDENSKGVVPPPFLYLDFEGGAADMSRSGLDGVVDGAVSFNVDGAPEGSTPRSGASFTGGHIDVPGLDMNAMIRDFEDGSYTMSAWINPSAVDGERFFFGQTNQGIHHGIRQGAHLHSAHWGADWSAQTVLTPGEWIHATFVYDGAADSATIYLNGELDGGPTAQRAPNGDGHLIVGARNNGDASYHGLIDDVAIWRELLSDGMIQALANGISPIGATQTDGDGDGLPDYWEDKFDVDDPEADNDNDGLTNAEEFAAKTNPNVTDSDDDGLSDSDEINIHNSSPFQADEDGDGLNDGDEIAAGTNTAKADTDEDGYGDGFELEKGSDPLDSSSTPSAADSLVLYLDFEDQVDDQSGHGNNGTILNDISFESDPLSNTGMALSLAEGGGENNGVRIPGTDLGSNPFTLSYWIKPTTAQANAGLERVTSRGGDQFETAVGDAGAVGGTTSETGTTLSYYCGGCGWRVTNVPITVGEWVHVTWVISPDSTILYINGEEAYTGIGITGPGTNDFFIGTRHNQVEGFEGLIDELRVYSEPLSAQNVLDVFNDTGENYIFQILELEHDEETPKTTITWASKPGRIYSIDFSNDLKIWSEIDDSIVSGGETTSFVDDFFAAENLQNGFYQVREN